MTGEATAAELVIEYEYVMEHQASFVTQGLI